MSGFDYPKVKLSLGRVSLKDSYPAWFLDPRGVIHAANLLSFWLWEAIRLGEAIRSDTLLGKSVFNVLTANLARIPVDQNGNFYEKKSAVVKRMDAGLQSPLYASFISAMEADPQLKQIYDYAAPNPDSEWEYHLRIAPPRSIGSTELLEFQVTIYRLAGDSGLLVVYIPMQSTSPLIEKQYSLLIDKYGANRYVQPLNMERESLVSTQIVTDLMNPSPVYYPALHHDLLWNITENNQAQLLLFGESAVGRHFFEMIFSAQFRKWQGPLYETSALRAIKYFDTLTADFRRENHEQHTEYEQVMKRLLRLPDFQGLLELSRKIPIHINLPDDLESAFYTCRVLLPWPISNNITLQFRSMSQLIRVGSPDWMNRVHEEWNVTLVPENYETEAALILLHLARVALSPKIIGDTPLKQFLWGLAVVKALQEGVKRENVDAQWQPQSAFRRIRKELDVDFSKVTEDSIEDVIIQLRIIIELLNRKDILNKKTMLDMLIDFIGNTVLLGELKQYLITELRIHDIVEGRLRVTDVPEGRQETEQVMLGDISGEGKVDTALYDSELKTMVFDDEEEYERFTDYVFEEFGGAGLLFTDAPIIASVRVTPQLLEQTKEHFAMRPVSDEDIEQASAKNQGRR